MWVESMTSGCILQPLLWLEQAGYAVVAFTELHFFALLQGP
jgi:hypothetical protein